MMPWLSTATTSGTPVESVALTTSYQTVYTAPAYNANVTTPSATARVLEFTVCNTTTGAITVNICKVPSAGTAGAGNALYYGVSVAANSTVVLSGLNTLLAPSDTIQVSASAAGLTLTPSFVQYQ